MSEKGRKIGFIPHGWGPGSRLLMTVIYRAGRAAAYWFLTVIACGGAAVKPVFYGESGQFQRLLAVGKGGIISAF